MMILRKIRYIATTVALLLATFLPEQLAARVAPGTSSVFSVATIGTTKKYAIATKEDFIKLMDPANKGYWKYDFVQVKDIDLSGVDCKPIGNPKYEKFSGSYDGRGYKLKNALYKWDDVTSAGSENEAVGIFGVLAYCDERITGDPECGVYNLVIENCRITRTSSTQNVKKVDYRLGVLAGMVESSKKDSKHIHVNNISLINCRIDDGGLPIIVRSLFVGGAIGDIANEFGGYSSFPDGRAPIIKNIYSNVAIDFTKCKRNTDDGDSGSTTREAQFNFGGIVGRIRYSVSRNTIPDKTIFTGKIIAPLGMASPTVACMRVNAYNGVKENKVNVIEIDSLASFYAGQIGNKNETSRWFGRDMTDEQYDAFCATRLYYNYRVFHTPEAQAGRIDEVTDVKPNTPLNSYKSRTFKQSTTGAFAYTEPSQWEYFQGVNFGSYGKDGDGNIKSDDILAMLNSDASMEYKDFAWEAASDTNFVLVRKEELIPSRFDIKIVPGAEPNIYIAKVYEKFSTIETNIEGTFTWSRTTSPQVGVWDELSETSATIDVGDTYRNTTYRVIWRPNATLGPEWDADLVAVRGPSLKIYVYDMDATLAANALLPDELQFNTTKYDVLGNDQFDGTSPMTPVKTMRRAYELLRDDGSMEENIIVIMGTYSDDKFWSNSEEAAQIAETGDYYYNKAATLTGTDKAEVSGGMLYMYYSGDPTYTSLRAPTTFDNLILLPGKIGNSLTESNSKEKYSFLIVCNNNDFTANDNLQIWGAMDMFEGEVNNVIPGKITTMPQVTLISGTNDNNTPLNEDIIYHPMNVEPGRSTVTLRSGVFGRVLCGSRNSVLNGTSHNITGSPRVPARVHLVVNIPGDERKDADGNYIDYYNIYGRRGFHNTTTGKYEFKDISYTHDIGIIAGGQTDGSMFGDVVIDIFQGHVARVITGNLSFGRATGNFPQDSYFGSSVVNIHSGVVNELYGGNLGRNPNNGILQAYYYGRSQINIFGGSVETYKGDRNRFDYPGNQHNLDELKKIDPSIYAGGAGGVMGLGDDNDHTPDPRIPYIPEGKTEIKYDSYAQMKADNGRMPVMLLFNGDTLDLSKTVAEINLYGGRLEGNIYGAGYGYSLDLPFKNAQPQAGNLYGTTYVRMEEQPNGMTPTVLGNIYGAGAGNSTYSTEWKKANPTLTVSPYDSVAGFYGDCHVILKAGVVGNRTTRTGGNVYGGARGVDGYTDMAYLNGNTNLEIDGSVIVVGNIYGGSALGSIKGQTNVSITGGIIGNNIFGGCQGGDDADHISTNNIVIQGGTNVNINGGTYTDISYDDNLAHKSFNIYGGGFYNCRVKGSTHLNITRSLYGNINSVDPDFLYDLDSYADVWDDILFRHFCVYGGGFGQQATVDDTAHVHINVDLEDVLIKPDDGKIFYPYKQFFDVAGGGYSGNVGTTDVVIDGNVNIRKVIGGGFYGAVLNNTNVNILGGCIGSVIGGCRLGHVFNAAHLTIGTRYRGTDPDSIRIAADKNSRLWFTDHVFGGNDVTGIVGPADYDFPEYDPANPTVPTVFDNDPANPGTPKEPHYWEEIGYEDVNAGLEGKTDEEKAAIIAERNKANTKGVYMTIYGGTFLQSVYGAGNGHYRGYYIPEWGAYDEGPESYYRLRPRRDGKSQGRVYKARPGTGRVHVNIHGNSETDRVVIQEHFYGGGRSCSLGRWYPPLSRPFGVSKEKLQFEDPRRLIGGGELHVNIGSYVTVKKHVHMGSEGVITAQQHTVPAGIDDNDYKLIVEADRSVDPDAALQPGTQLVRHRILDRLGAVSYDHWYWDSNAETTDPNQKGRYRPGFPEPGKININPKDLDFKYLSGEHMFYGAMKAIEMNNRVVLTFYNLPYSNVEDKWTNWKLPGDPEIDVSQNFDAKDVRFGSFFFGGKAGFMTYEPDPSENKEYAYDITLPYGVTVENVVVAGGEDTWLKYYKFGEKAQSIDSTQLYYQIMGGLSTQSNFDSNNDGYLDMYDADGNLVYWDETTRKFKGVDDTSIERTADDMVYAGIETRQRTGNYAIRMNIASKFDPQLAPSAYDADGKVVDQTKRFGGLIYGGCYNSGIINGDVVLNVASNLLGDNPIYIPSDSAQNVELFADLSSLKYNVGRVYGGGFGENTHTQGNVYVHLLKNFCGFNVFGGGHQGDVYGTAHINYIGTEDSYIFGAIYGGGMLGNVGRFLQKTDASDNLLFTDDDGVEMTADDPRADGKSLTPVYVPNYTPANFTQGDDIGYATKLRLYSGNVDKVYGGSCLGNLYGGAKIYLCDQVTSSLEHFNWAKLKSEGWAESRLICGFVYGGNDIGGRIVVNEDTDEQKYYTTNIWVNEEQLPNSSPRTDSAPRYAGNTGSEGDEAASAGKDSPGSHDGYNGFPLIGNLYGGSNAAYGSHTLDKQFYTPTSIVSLANGHGDTIIDVNLNTHRYRGQRFTVPHIAKSNIKITGGTIINAFGGGNGATITGETKIEVNYADTVARAGFASEEEAMRYWYVMHMSSDEQFNEVLRRNLSSHAGNSRDFVFSHQIMRLFGGNDDADMSIQPTWNLVRGHVGSVYSGGNIGRMTYYNPNPDRSKGEFKGLSLTVNSPTMHIENVYGGGRVGSICATDAAGNEVTSTSINSFYGGVLNIQQGIIEHVYGGNDVAGEVKNGTWVNISGAISGDVYGAGNGNYLYYYDRSGKTKRVTEMYDNQRGRYFVMPRKPEYGTGSDEYGEGANPTDAQVVMAINSYRPHVERCLLQIEGSPERKVWVKGSVYCGGNSSTITSYRPDVQRDIKFKIGSHVILNGVHMGANGAELSKTLNIDKIAELNALGSTMLDLTADNDLTAGQVPEFESAALDKSLYPKILDLYMRAVEVEGLPDDFKFDSGLTEAYIGDFCIGGNNGSMMTEEEIKLEFPKDLIIFGSIIGGCRNANVTYNNVTHIGGLTKPLKDGEEHKVHLVVKSKFLPLVMKYPDNAFNPQISIHEDIVDADGNSVMKEVDDGAGGIKYIIDPAYTGLRYYPAGKCNIYGGCYTSGRTVGNILLDVYSDMLDYNTSPDADRNITNGDGVIIKEAIVNGIDGDKGWRTFNIIGGGFGKDTEVYGDITLRMLPGKNLVGITPVEGSPLPVEAPHPSAGGVFGGSLQGLVVGNARVEIRDGKVLTNVYGASEAAKMYGSTSVMVGYPEYYVANESREYTVKRADNLSKAYKNNLTDTDGNPIILQKVKYLAGDVVASNTYEMIVDDTAFTRHQELPASFHGTKWDDIEIWVGDQSSHINFYLDENDRRQNMQFYRYGNIYGGGFVHANAAESLAGKNTLCKYTVDYRPLGSSTDIVGYGGNTNVMVWDNKENADISIDLVSGKTSDGSVLKDHVSVGTGVYSPVAVKVGGNKMGYYCYDAATNKMVHQPSGTITAEDIANNVKFYEIKADGGIYGGGRKVFAEGFRALDMGYYGYADHNPQEPKLLNTIQRSDVVTIRDCCMQLQGASDFTIVGQNSLNSTDYSINRVGELQMISSLNPEEDLVSGSRDTQFMNNVRHDEPRSRNYLAFFQHINQLAAFTSNWSIDDPYHGYDGKMSTSILTTDTTPAVEPVDGEPSSNTYFTSKHGVVKSYYESDKGLVASKQFSRRNVGSSGNMIGINNGYTMEVKGSYYDTENHSSDNSYYGPVFGVTEVKLLTLAQGEGGGYIYALNHHYDKNYDPTEHQCADIEGHYDHQDFMFTTGNFVFPGAAFLLNEGADNYNFIIDDCYPPGAGYDNILADKGNGVNVNEEEECHYWYVNGQRYFFNITLTAVTSDDLNRSFFINNEDNMVHLVGAHAGSDIKVKSVLWTPHNTPEEGDNCDLSNLEKNYKLFFTVDKDTKLTTTTGSNGAFVTQIPRSDYEYDGADTWPEEKKDTSVKPNDSSLTGTFGNKTVDGSSVINSPALGIRLLDNEKNRKADLGKEASREFFDTHMKGPHKVTVTLTSQNPGESVEFEYVINLTINYLLGPVLNGNIVIENCALPGEYIYANSFGVTMEMDEENMSVTDSYWKLYPTKVNESGERERIILPGTTEYASIKLDTEEFTIPKTSRLIHLPAYWYQNGWELAYVEVANGFEFEALTASDAEHKALTIHNYHRMKPKLGSNIVDLRPVPGARIYIENKEDMYYFLQMMVASQKVNNPAGNYGAAGDDYVANKNFVSLAGDTIWPGQLRGLDFYMQTDVELPNTAIGTSDKIWFNGTLHGNGHRITIGSSTSMLLNLGKDGNVFNTGFLSSNPNPATNVFDINLGQIRNCYYFSMAKDAGGNLSPKGSLVSFTNNENNTIAHMRNCYQNTPVPMDASNNPIFSFNQLMQLSTNAFRYGQVAYNLNGFYLVKRDILIHKEAEGVPFAEKNNNKLHDNRDVLLKQRSDYDEKYAVDYVEKMFNNGDYRYAYSKAFAQYTEALRTEDIPNYFDRLNIRGSEETPAGIPTHHDITHPRDNVRWDETAGKYRPTTDIDYLFFGEDVTKRMDETNNQLPERFTPENRVYRVGGFYGSAADKGYFFNKQAYLDSEIMTAVDFVGYRDRELAATNVSSGGWFKSPDIRDDGWIIKEGKHEVYYPPTLDIPVDNEGNSEFESFDIDDCVTHNLVIYTDNDPLSKYFQEVEKYDYNKGATYASDHDLAMAPDSRVRAHHVVDIDITDDGVDNPVPMMHGRFFQLADKYDFNAPVAFKVRNAWYNREPADFADGVADKSAWEGLCLPFDVRKVYSASVDGTAARDHRELTHFYGNEEAKHEYWLRRYVATGVKDGKTLLMFERPTAANRQGSREDIVADHIYYNPFFCNTYQDKLYNFDHAIYDEERTLKDYRHITRGVPYIVTYPGERYYEFDLSGNFYATIFEEDEIIPQTISYMAKTSFTDLSLIEIPVTDEIPPVDYTDSGNKYVVKGTYVHVNQTGAQNLGAINVDGDGTKFVKTDEILPFRTYVVSGDASAAPLYIASRGADNPVDPNNKPKPDDGDDDQEVPGVRVYTEGSDLLISSPADFDTLLYNTMGQAVRHLTVREGLNRYTGLTAGLYIVLRTKVKIE